MTTPPLLKRPAYHVWVSPDPDRELPDEQLQYHHVTVHHADQLRAELEANKQGLRKGGSETPFHLTSLWLWAAMVRTERYDGNYASWKLACVSYDPDRDRESPHTDPEDEQTSDDLDAHPTEASTS